MYLKKSKTKTKTRKRNNKSKYKFNKYRNRRTIRGGTPYNITCTSKEGKVCCQINNTPQKRSNL